MLSRLAFGDLSFGYKNRKFPLNFACDESVIKDAMTQKGRKGFTLSGWTWDRALGLLSP